MFGVGRKIRMIALGLGVLAVAGSVYAGYRFVSNLVDQNELLANRVGQLEAAKAVQDSTIAAQQRAIEEWSAAREQLAAQLQELSDVRIKARAERERLLREFASSDLEEEISRDPVAVQNRLNLDAARARCVLARASGADRDCDDGGRGEALVPTTSETGTD